MKNEYKIYVAIMLGAWLALVIALIQKIRKDRASFNTSHRRSGAIAGLLFAIEKFSWDDVMVSRAVISISNSTGFDSL